MQGKDLGKMLKKAQLELRANSNPRLAEFQHRFMRADKGEYAEGDRFLGLTVPQTRAVAHRYRDLPLPYLEKLIRSPFHEIRLMALIILNHQYKKATLAERKKLFRFYVKNIHFINHWDLVDVSAPHVPGQFLLTGDRRILNTWVKSKSLWIRRISVISTFALIRNQEFAETLSLCEQLLTAPEDLIHKATGWMLREVGKRDLKSLTSFLNRYAPRMPRTMLRYAIEKLPEKQRKAYLQKK